MAKQKRRSGVLSGELTPLKNAVRGARNKYRAVRDVRPRLKQSGVSEFVKWLHLDTTLRAELFGTPKPQSLMPFELRLPLPPIGMGSELRWVAGWLAHHNDHLKTFVAKASDFSELLLQHEYGAAGRILDEIESQCGISFWLIRNRFAFLQELGGLEAQKNYLSQLRAQMSPNGVADLLMNYLSIRVETGVTQHRLKEQFDAVVTGAKIDDDLRAYLEYVALDQLPNTPDGATAALRYVALTSAIDAYECLVGLARGTVLTEPGLRSAIAAAGVLLGGVDDRRWVLIRCLTSSSPYIASDEDIAVASALNAHALSDDAVADSADVPLIPGTIEILRRSGGRVDRRPAAALVNRILDACAVYERREGDSEAALAALEKLALNWSSLEIGRWLRGLLDRERFFGAAYSQIAGGAPHFDLAAAEAATAGRVRAVWSDWLLRAGFVVAARYVEYDYARPATTDLTPSAAMLFRRAQAASAAGDWSESIAACDEALLRRVPDYLRNRLVMLLAQTFVQTSRLIDAVHLIVQSHFERPDLVRSLPIEALAQRIGKHITPYAATIDLPIFYDLLSRLRGNNYDSLRRYAYDDFLRRNGADRPIELLRHADAFERQRLLYFLRFVCVEPVMDVSLSFTGSRQVAEERLAVCRELIDLDVDNRPTYEHELTAIARSLTLTRRLREIERSKIYVDVDAIVNRLVVSVRPVFEQFRELRAIAPAKMQHALRRAIDAVANKESGIVVFRLPADEAIAVLEHAAAEVRDAYVANNEHGLNWYLSTRIRHGVLGARLRRPLQSAGLLSEAGHGGDAASRNDAWVQRTGARLQTSAVRMSRAIEDFTRNVDAIAESIVNEWIQIRRAATPNGMFNFDLAPADIAEISAALHQDSTVERFVAVVLIVLEKKLDISLAAIRYRLEHDTRSRFDELLSQLQYEIEEIPLDTPGPLLVTITAARGEMLNTLRSIAEWFRRSAETTNEPFTLPEAVDIACEIRDRLGRPIEAQITVGSSATMSLPGTKCAAIVDVFSILFENIDKHSGVAGRPRVTVQVDGSPETGSLTAVVENELSPSVLLSDRPARVENIRRALADGDYVERVSKEGGTGLFKVARTLEREFPGRCTFTFHFSETNTFVVEFTISLEFAV